jgi:hypothetical protein
MGFVRQYYPKKLKLSEKISLMKLSFFKFKYICVKNVFYVLTFVTIPVIKEL